VKDEIYDYGERLRRYKRIIAGFGHNGEVALQFLDHLVSLGLSMAKISKYVGHLIVLLRVIDLIWGELLGGILSA